MKGLVIKINVYCSNRGWLFEDLKAQIAALGAVASTAPLGAADAYICIRTKEAKLSPRPDRTVVQVHDMTSRPVNECGIVSFVHPVQVRQWRAAGFTGKAFLLPIGSRDIPLGDLPDRPTIGFFCRERGQAKGSAIFAAAVDYARKISSKRFDVLMIGANLDRIARLGRYEKRGAGADDYQRIDALFVASGSVMVPLSLYEALAGGRRVITTPRIFPVKFEGIFESDNVLVLGDFIKKIVNKRVTIPPQKPYDRATWCRAQIEAALDLVKGGPGMRQIERTALYTVI